MISHDKVYGHVWSPVIRFVSPSTCYLDIESGLETASERDKTESDATVECTLNVMRIGTRLSMFQESSDMRTTMLLAALE